MATADQIADALAGRHGPVKVSWRFHQRDLGYHFVADLTTAITHATVSLDNFRAITRTANFDMRPDLLPPSFNDDSQIAVIALLQVPATGETVQYDFGLFNLDNISEAYAPPAHHFRTVGAADVMVLAWESYKDAPTVVPAGTVITTAAADLLIALGLETFIDPSSKRVAIDQVWDANIPVARIVNDLLESINYYPAYADGQGVVRSSLNLDPFIAPIDVEYTSVAEPRMVSGTGRPFRHMRSRAQYINRVAVTIDDPRLDQSAIVVINDDVDSRISTVNKGATTSQRKNGDRFDCDPCRAEYGRNLLRHQSVMSQQGELLTRLDLRRGAHEHYRINLPGADEVDSRWRVLGWDVVVDTESPPATMVHRIGRASELTLTTSTVTPSVSA